MSAAIGSSSPRARRGCWSLLAMPAPSPTRLAIYSPALTRRNAWVWRVADKSLLASASRAPSRNIGGSTVRQRDDELPDSGRPRARKHGPLRRGAVDPRVIPLLAPGQSRGNAGEPRRRPGAGLRGGPGGEDPRARGNRPVYRRTLQS